MMRNAARRIGRRVIPAVLLLVFLLQLALPVHATELIAAPLPEIVSDYAVVMDADTGAVLYDKNMNTASSPASLTKIMTAYMTLKHGNLTDTVTMTQEGVSLAQNGLSNLYTQVGEVFTVEQLLYGTMVKSANDMATQLAVYVGGSVDQYLQMANEEAARLGCTNTHFGNACGWPDEGNTTTPYDLAVISRAALQYDFFRTLVGTAQYSIPPTNMIADTRTFQPHNPLIVNPQYAYEGTIGGKTGYTDIAQSCLAEYVQRGDMTLIAVGMHCTGGTERNALDDMAILDYAFANYEHLQLADEAFPDITATATVRKGTAFEDLEVAEERVTEEEGIFQKLTYLQDGRAVGERKIPADRYDAYQQELAEAARAEEEARIASEAEAAAKAEAEARPTYTVIKERKQLSFPHSIPEFFQWIEDPMNLVLSGILFLILILLIIAIAMRIRNGAKKRKKKKRKKNA